MLAFSDSEVLRALETITSRRPVLVALEGGFASTRRGTALLNRVKADPSLAGAMVRVESSNAEVLDASTVETPSPAPAAEELDRRGTRRAERYPIDGSTEVVIDGKPGNLIDLSILGAQVVTTAVLRPNQRVRLVLAGQDQTVRCTATVIWASFEIPKGSGPRYRVGVDFIAPDTAAIEAYIRRHSRT